MERTDPAFPIPQLYRGLTKRELFAAMALQGWLADSGGSMSSARDAARYAVDHADALIEALSK